MTFGLTTLLWAAVLAATALLFGGSARWWPDAWRKLPRHRGLGTLLSLVCLAWSAWHAQFLLEGGLARFRPALWAAVPAVAALAFFHLDFLFARALGGFMLLYTPLLLHQAFTVDLPGRPLFSLLCYAYGLAGMGLVAVPWYFRDALQRATEHDTWRRLTTLTFALSAALYVVFALLA